MKSASYAFVSKLGALSLNVLVCEFVFKSTENALRVVQCTSTRHTSASVGCFNRAHGHVHWMVHQLQAIQIGWGVIRIISNGSKTAVGDSI